MDKQTRKLNLKKLQLPASSKQRHTRSNKETAISSISNYFTTPKKNNSDALAQQKSCNKSPTNLEQNSPNKPKCKRTKLSTFLNKEEDNELPLVPKLPQRESDVFEKAQPKVRKAPKLTSTATTTGAKKSTRKGRTKKQPSIKSAFLRNEEIFSEITAQHCIADNFSPDDIELALALSKSESHPSVSTECTEQPEEVVDLNARDSVRSKLLKYGFRTASKEDYNKLAIPFLPGVNRGKRSKWANKFTALTLRNPEHQAKKLNNNIDALLAKQFKTKPLSKEESLLQPYKIVTKSLRYLESERESKIISNVPERATNDITSFYVKDLFEVSSLSAGHLLKNWSAIQGRDLSPERQSEQSNARIQKLKEAYENLELHFFARNKSVSDSQQILTSVAVVSKIKATETCVENDCTPKKENQNEELDELLKLIDEDENNSESLELSLTISSPIKEPPDKRARMQSETIVSNESNKENLMMRSTSPDIFGDSDGDDSTLPTVLECEGLPTGAENEELLGFSMKAHKHISIAETSENIETFEVFSSDDVKNSVGDNDDTPKIERPYKSFIDLTADENEPLTSEEIKSILGPFKSNCKHSLLNVSHSFIKSPNREYDMKADQTNLTLKSQTEFEKILDQSSFCEIKSTNELNSSSHDKVTKTTSKLTNLGDKCGKGTSSNRKSNSFSQSLESPIFHHNMERKSRSFVDSNQSNNSAELENSLKTSLDTLKMSNRSLSFTAILQESANSIDLTQNESEEDDNDGDCILLSDDEINYSIWKADKTQNTKESELLQRSNESSLNSSISSSLNASATKLNSINRKTISPPVNDSNEDEKATFAPIRFDRDEEIDAFMVCSQTYSEKSGNSRSPNKSLLSRERAEFGIMDAALSEPISFSQLEKINATEKEEIDWNDASFLDSPSDQTSSIKRYSCNKNKFSNLLSQVSKSTETEINTLDEMDEFDKIVFGAIKSYNLEPAVPSGLDQLLTAEINFQMPSENESPVPSSTKRKKVTHDELNLPEEVEINGNVYTVRVCRTPKPDFTRMSDAEMLKQLYNYGIKPLKRKQAIKMLEFVYNQTHPIMLAAYETEQEPSKTPKESTWCKSISAPLLPSKPPTTNCRTLTQTKSSIFPDTNLISAQNSDDGKLQLHDAFGDQLLRFSQQLRASLVDDDEYYVLQTNVTKKTPQPLLPLHIAWHNLLCANPELHEKVLMYEPIDLQEIYLYLKSLGYRYDPRELKIFFDRRCIIFRYELTAPNKQVQRQVRKPKSKK